MGEDRVKFVPGIRDRKMWPFITVKYETGTYKKVIYERKMEVRLVFLKKEIRGTWCVMVIILYQFSQFSITWHHYISLNGDYKCFFDRKITFHRFEIVSSLSFLQSGWFWPNSTEAPPKYYKCMHEVRLLMRNFFGWMRAFKIRCFNQSLN